MKIRTLCVGLALGTAAAMAAQRPAAPAGPEQDSGVTEKPIYTVPEGTKIPLQLINSVSTKTAAVGDRVYLQTVFPILSGGRIVIPPGSYVTGTVTDVRRGGKVKGRAELYLRFDSLTLPNGVTRDFRAGVHSVDATNPGRVDRTEGKVEGESNKSGDAIKVGEAAGWGTMIGGVATRSGKGAGIGAAAGAAAGLVGVLLTRGPDAILERGTTIEMVLDRTLKFEESELEGLGTASAGPRIVPPREPQKQSPRLPLRRFP